jgi:hypothetical protein
VRGDRDVGIVFLTPEIRSGGPASVTWFHGRRGEPALVRVGENVAPVPLPQEREVYTARITGACEERELLLTVEPFLKRRSSN